jgi:3-deoxy-manno-octulosonate cytidylyltransferase (CMP-KDO synthetase)
MVHWVWEAARRARGVDRVLVATDSEEIFGAVARFGGEPVMTRGDHASGTDRVAEVARSVDCRVVVNLQGDEPLLPPGAIEVLVERFVAQLEGTSSSRCPMGTLVSPLTDPSDLSNPARVKVVRRTDGRALYFSRLPIPFDRDRKGTCPTLRHVGIYVYERDFLLRFAATNPSPLELSERLEQLRALENGFEILTVDVEYDGIGVDTQEDLEIVRRRIASATR